MESRYSSLIVICPSVEGQAIHSLHKLKKNPSNVKIQGHVENAKMKMLKL